MGATKKVSGSADILVRLGWANALVADKNVRAPLPSAPVNH